MLPNIDVTTAAGVSGAAAPTPVKRPEPDNRAEDTYRAAQNIADVSKRTSDERKNAVAASEAASESKAAEATQPVQKQIRPGTRSYERAGVFDRAEINFQLTREEREVFLNAMSGQEDPADMTKDEQNTLQKVAERIEKLLDEAELKSTDRVDRLDKAIKEWYSRLSNGKHKPPTDLIGLIRLAAVGDADLSKIE